jgi:hypothetical protein
VLLLVKQAVVILQVMAVLVAVVGEHHQPKVRLLLAHQIPVAAVAEDIGTVQVTAQVQTVVQVLL